MPTIFWFNRRFSDHIVGLSKKQDTLTQRYTIVNNKTWHLARHTFEILSHLYIISVIRRNKPIPNNYPG